MGTGWRRAFCTSVPRDSDFSVPRDSGSTLTPSPPSSLKTSEIPHSPSSSSSSPSPRFALFKAALRLSKKRCGVCTESVNRGGGGERTAVFTAECSHVFHFPCISAHVRRHGRLICPVCSATWHEVPLLSPSLPPAKTYNDDESLFSAQFGPIPEELDINDDDDDKDLILITDYVTLVSNGRTHLTYVASVKLKAPHLPPQSKKLALLDHPSCRAPIDLVTVLDVGGSMSSSPPKLQMLKRAMRMVISSMGDGDRLSIVAFSSSAAKRLLPLQRMSRSGQKSARLIVDRLVASGSSRSERHWCVGNALRKATKVLEDRRERNPVATIMLLSDQQQQETGGSSSSSSSSTSFNSSSGTRFSHIEMPIVEESNDDNIAKCLKGLVSVVLQDVQLQFVCQGVISSVYSYSGGCDGGIANATSHGEGGRCVRIGDIYAGEERQLLIEIRVPKSDSVSMALSVFSSYIDPVTREVVHCNEKPIHAGPSTVSSVEVRNLFVTTRAMAESRRLVEIGDLDTAIHLLSSARALVLTQQANAQRELVVGLEVELEGLQRQRRRQKEAGSSTQGVMGGGGEALTPTSAWRAAEQLAKVAIMRKSMNRVGDLHGFENARF